MIDQVSDRKLVVLGVRKAADVPDKLHLAAALGALRRKNVEMARNRGDVKPWTVDVWSRHTAALTLDELTGRKYFPLFYLERAGVDAALDRLGAVPGGALLLLGEAGAGKSSLVARLAERRLGVGPVAEAARWVSERTEATDIVAWLAGRVDYAAPGDAGPGTLLVEALGRKLGIAPGAFASAADLLAHLESLRLHDQYPDRRIWLLLDGLNEAERFVDLVTEIDALLPHLAALPRVRLVVAMRTGAFQALAARAAGLLRAGPPVFAHVHHFMTFRDGDEDQHWLAVRPFRLAVEGPAAYARRQAAMPAAAAAMPWTALDSVSQRLLLRPLYLHLFHQTWAGQTVAPRGLTEGRLLDDYLRMLDGAADGSIAGLGHWLGLLARGMLERRSATLPITEAEGWRADWLRENHFDALPRAAKLDPLEELVSAGVLRPLQTGAGAREREGYGFTHQKLAERVLLRALDAGLGPGGAPDDARWTRWLAAAQAEPPFPELVGALGDWAARLVMAGAGGRLALLLDVADDTVRNALLQRALAATVHTAAAVAERVLAQVAQHAVSHKFGRERWLYGGGTVADQLAAQAPTPAMRRIWIGLLAFAQSSSVAIPVTDPDSAQAQRDLSVSCDRLGDLALRLNDGAGARAWFEKGLAIAEAQAAADPDSAEAQRDLSVSCDRLGDLALRLNDGAGARAWFEKGLAIDEALAAADPDSAQAQRDLSVSCDRLGDLALRLNDGAGARAWFEKGLAIAEAQAAADPDSAQAQRDLSVSCDRLGDLALRLNDGAGARAWFEKGLAIDEALAAADPDSAQAQRDLSVSCIRLGDLALRLNDGAGARAWFERGLAIREALATADPDSAQAQRDLSVSCIRLGDLALRLNDGAGARAWFERGLAIREALATADPDSAQAQRDLALSFANLGQTALRFGDVAAGCARLLQAKAIIDRLLAADPTDADSRGYLDAIERWRGEAGCAP